MKYFMSGSKFISSPKKAGKSHLVIEWTSQHGCGHGDLDCNVVLQYMCQNDQFESFDRRKASIDTIRNGKTEGTIPYRAHSDGFLGNPENKKNVKKQASRLEFGMHEPWEWYDKCYRRPRNKGLFTADQNVKDDQGSTATRQDPNGGNAGRNGYECPEERDYFPYWHPSDWKDIAVYVTNKEHCDFYKHFSFNRHPKGECLEKYNGGEKFKHYSRYNNPTDCKANGKDWIVFRSFIDIKDEYKNKASCEQATTKDVPLVWGVPYKSELVDSLELDPVTKKPKEFCLVQPPELDCKVSPVSRPNHLGNVVDSYAMNYTWIIPYFPSQNQKRCVVRIRYNISTYDYDGNKTFSDKNGAQNSPVTNDPKVAFKNDLGNDFDLQLAVNTAQFGRTFQDRSHVMILMARTNKISDDVAVYNLNVRGKRGNIVQVYPAVEYDFVPKSLYVTSDDIVHIQWTGSTRNPGNNDGEGRAGTDKNNMVEIDDSGTNVKFKENSQMIRSATLKWTPDIQLKTMEDVAVALATSGFDFTGGKNNRLGVSENRRLNFQNQLDNSPASFGTALSFAPGSYKYMCTRNNNFSNRNQKGTIIVTAESLR
ncbi:protein DD3-3-like [Dendronephthya gigantea]|uniref:protein DD3-3-like n=1 Tax=Dendronephthya gigantea TaxID=151771 RepID=UPI00106AF9C5|nr:protein DD3-3-like [Dendronephthya gigantea]